MPDALCREPDYPATWWHPPRGVSARYALDVCQRCTVRAECLAYALDEHLEAGIWGGTTPEERRKLARAPIGAGTVPRAS